MSVTTAQINNTLRLKTTFTVGNTGSPPPDTVKITDLSNWSSIVSSSTDKVNIILQISDPAGQIVYQNTGWVSANFSSPDLYFGSVPVTVTTAKTLLYDANGNLITGTFTVEAQVQVIVDYATTPVTTYGGGVTNPTLCSDYLQSNLHPAMLFAEDCAHANMTVSDATVYGAYTSITRSITVTPPVEATQSPFTASSNSVLVTNLWSPAPYQGQINNVVTYTTGDTVTISYINYFQNHDTDCDQSLCELSCCLRQLYVDMMANAGVNTTVFNTYKNRLDAGIEIYILCQSALACSRQSEVEDLKKQFYKVTGCSTTCGCGCSDKPSPVVPVSPSQGPAGNDGVGISTVAINGSNHLIITLTNNQQIDAGLIPSGTNGTNGSVWRNGSGVPSNSLGADGDYYIDNDTSKYYLKVSGAYVLQGSFKGANGTTELWNPLIVYTNTGGTGNAVTRSIPANSFTTIGDKLTLSSYVNFLTNHVFTFLPITIGGASLALITQSSTSVGKQEQIVKMIYSAANTLTVQVIYQNIDGSGVALSQPVYGFGSTVTFDPTIANDLVYDFSNYPDNAVELALSETELIKL